MLERVKGMPLIVTNTHTREIAERLHSRNVRVAFYVNFYATHSPAGMEREIARREQAGEIVQEEWYLIKESPFYKILDPSLHPQWLWIGEDGYPRKKPATYEEVYHGNTVCLQLCPNAVGVREAALAAVKTLMDLGIDGVFIDCAGANKRCWGPELGFHKHVHPEMDGIQAWRSLLQGIYALVKSYGEDKVVILNAEWDPASLRYADASMQESYILTSVSRRRWYDWAKIQEIRKQMEPVVKAGKVVLALSYVGYTPNGMDEDAFYAYACSRLFGYTWADWFTLADARATLLYRLDLGAPRGEVLESNGVLYKLFQNGLVALNPNYDDRELHIKTGFMFVRELLTDRRFSPWDYDGCSPLSF